MSRNTHDRDLDHHGMDSISNQELTEFLGPYASGRSLVEVLADILERISVLEHKSGIFSFTIDAYIE